MMAVDGKFNVERGGEVGVGRDGKADNKVSGGARWRCRGGEIAETRIAEAGGRARDMAQNYGGDGKGRG